MVLTLSLKLSTLLNTKPYLREVLGILSSAKINPSKKIQDWHPLKQIHVKINLA